MSRSADEGQRRARHYRRRRAVLEAQKNANTTLVMAKELLAELAALGASAQTLRDLRRRLEDETDITRSRAALWALVDAVERACAGKRHRPPAK